MSVLDRPNDLARSLTVRETVKKSKASQVCGGGKDRVSYAVCAVWRGKEKESERTGNGELSAGQSYEPMLRSQP